MNNEKIAKYIASAEAAFEAGFTTMSGKKEAISGLNAVYEELRDRMQEPFLATPHSKRTAAQEALYYLLPFYLHTYRAAHGAAMVAEWPELVDFPRQIEELVSLRAAIKDAEIIKVERTQQDPRIAQIAKSLMEIRAAHQAQYLENVELFEVFGSLSVNCHTHGVVNQHGHSFDRNMFFLNGKRTALQVILGVMDAAAKIEEKKKQAA